MVPRSGVSPGFVYAAGAEDGMGVESGECVGVPSDAAEGFCCGVVGSSSSGETMCGGM